MRDSKKGRDHKLLRLRKDLEEMVRLVRVKGVVREGNSIENKQKVWVLHLKEI